MWTLIIVFVIIAVIAILFAFWAIPEEGTGRWWEEISSANKCKNQYD